MKNIDCKSYVLIPTKAGKQCECFYFILCSNDEVVIVFKLFSKELPISVFDMKYYYIITNK